MNRILLQSMVEDIPENRLPVNWVDFDLASFSRAKTLWDYQQKALQNALKALWKYYEDFGDYQENEDVSVNQKRKEKLWEWYQNNGLQGDFSIPLADLLREHYEADGNRIDYKHFINRMSFWMATGSGKTLVIVKLIELLARLIQREEIPPCDILFLTHRDDLLEQLKRHVEEFNQGHSDLHIVLRELREYASVKRESPSLFQEQKVIVFYYRSDNLSDEQKEKIIDFRNYDNGGRWYLLLDEAHKGDREESKRQHIYAILSRNGFLFNFSATFTDLRDIATTVFNFNLSEYIRAGYGKHIAILKQEMRAFRDKDDYTNEEKQKIVLKALMMLAYVHKAHKAIHDNSGNRFYHRPLMLVLVNSVNTENADLQLFFRELERIAREGVTDEVWEAAKSELLKELQDGVPWEFENDNFKIDEQDKETWQALTYADLLQLVFNAQSSGEIEVLIRPSNRQEMAFKLKTADRPFALIKIGDISKWLKEKLEGYEINERFEDESYFARLNEDDSDITVLMGSRTFYEGWDSNRPNVICYINIGVGEDARKFILQSIGRGVRIEPLKNKRKRLLHLHNAGEVDKELFEQLKDQVFPLETLFIFGTNRQALQTVIQSVQQERARTGERQLTLFEVNPEAKKEGRLLLIPTYKPADKPLADVRQIAKFEVDKSEFEVMKSFVETADNRVLLLLCQTTPQRLRVLRRSLSEADKFYKHDGRKHGNLLRLLNHVLDYLGIVPEEVERLKELEDEIRHFRHIAVTLTDITELQSKMEAVKSYPDKVREVRALYGKVSPEEYEAKSRELDLAREFSHDGQKILIKHIAQHYYLPVVLSESERVDYIRHIIKTPSEVKFVKDLENYLAQSDNKFNEFDWWFFSKLDESLDEVYLPYYDPKANRIAKFKPDFIFWLKKGNRFLIVFVDPKGTEHVDWQRKVDGYRVVFEENGTPRVFRHDGSEVTVHLFLRTNDVSKVPNGYREFWFDKIASLPTRLLEHADLNAKPTNF